jgi:hypothetical protein
MIAPWRITLGWPWDHREVSDEGRLLHLHEKVPVTSAVEVPGDELAVVGTKESGRYPS